MLSRDREPSASGYRNGRSDAATPQARRTTTATRRSSRRPVSFHIRALVHEADGTTRQVEFDGRPAETLDYLIGAGERGITSLDTPKGWRLAHFVFLLRRGGVPIGTIRVQEDGVTYGRYVLTRPVTLVQFWRERYAA